MHQINHRYRLRLSAGRLAACVPVVCVCVVSLMGAGGCQHPSYEAALQRRMDSQRRVWDQYVTSERKRPGNLQDLAASGKALNELYADRLKMTLEVIEKRRAGEWTGWDDQTSKRQEQLRKLLEGQPEKIPRVWREISD